MWKLQSIRKEHLEHFLFVGEECIVGRKNATLLISDDPSISRKHAVLFIRHPEENLGNLSKKSSLFLRDEGSKYGTFKNGIRISTEEELTNDDIVKFGQFESEFRVCYTPLVITTSCLDVASKNKLKKYLHLLGGHLVSEWQPLCTHLVMSEVKVTVKALCCLVSLKPIVLPDYFEELEKKLKSSSTIISPKKFLPPIGESLIDKDKVSFDIIPQRKNMFKGKTFFFMDEKQYKKLYLGVITGGGNASILSKSKDNIESVLSENTCVIEPVKTQVKDETKNFLKDVISFLQKKKLRIIPESDIGLAVAYASTETFCNPSFDVGSVILSSQNIPSQTFSEREVYVPDTSEQYEKLSSKRHLSSFESQQTSKKQKLEAPDSLNLTAEELFEIPLSAELKQEIDVVFEATMEVECNAPEKVMGKLPLTSEVTTHSCIKNLSRTDIFAKEKSSSQKQIVEQNVSVPETNKRKIEPVTRSSKKVEVEKETLAVNCSGSNGNSVPRENSTKNIKIERDTSAVNCNGSNSIHENDENLPWNLIKIEYADLIVRAPTSVVPQPNQNSNVKNFKKFKKVYPKKASVLPKIIGGHDLIPYDKDASKIPDNWDDEDEPRIPTTVKGAFDWDTPND